MGLHAHIVQTGPCVNICLHGQIREAELDQLGAIVSHYHDRGCQTFVLDLTGTLPLSATAAGHLASVLHTSAPKTADLPQPDSQRLGFRAVRRLGESRIPEAVTTPT